MQEYKPNFKLKPNELFISSSLLNNIIKNSDIKKAIIEETTSELWYETLHGYGNLTFKNKIQYTGNLRYGILCNEDSEKPCTIIFPNGTKYTGTMVNNEITGEGEYLFSNGSTYTGTVLNGLRDGKGIFQSNDGIIYEGEWKKGLKHGKGKIIQGNMELEGEWKEGVIYGKCRINWKSGNIFEGELVDNKLHGNGYMVWKDKNEKYTGRWENNLQNGLGIHIWYDNRLGNNKFFRDRYVGQWKDGKRNGYGKFYYSNGSIYEGYWKNDKKEGFGILYFYDRTKISGIFKNDIFLKDLQIITLNSQNNKNDSKKKIPLKSMKSIRKQTMKSNISSDTSRGFDNSTNKLEVIKEGKKEENQEKKENEELTMNKTKQKSLKDKKEKIIKNIEEIKIPIWIEDITVLCPIEKPIYKELDNLILRNLSIISHLYMYACGKEDIKSSDIGLSTVSPSIISEPKSLFKQLSIKKEQNSKDRDKNIVQDDNNNVVPQNEEKKEKVVDLDNIYNNDLYFSLDFKSLWKLLRECGLICPSFSLAMVNRIIFKNPENNIEMFFIPEELEKLNKNKENYDIIYNLLYQKILHSKNNFEIKYKSLIDQSSIVVYGSLPPNEIYPDYIQKEENEINKDINIPNFHDEKNIILLRYFYEILIRIAYLRFNDEEDLPLEGRVKKLFDLLKLYFRMRRKTGIDSSITAISIVDPKLRNFEIAQELFIDNHYEILKNIFVDLYKHSCHFYQKAYKSFDMTISYKFFYDKIIKNSEKLSNLFEEKLQYIDLISLFYKDKKICSNNVEYIDIDDNELFEYLESIYEYEMIFREFCELIFNISRKFFHFYEIETEYEDNKGVVLTKEEEKKREEEEKKLNKKKKKKHKNKNIDIYMLVIDEVIKAKNVLKEKSDKYNRINKYYYPILKTHKIIERNKEEERQRKFEEEKRENEIKRYENEREKFKEEDINIYKVEEKNENNSDSDSMSDY